MIKKVKPQKLILKYCIKQVSPLQPKRVKKIKNNHQGVWYVEVVQTECKLNP